MAMHFHEGALRGAMCELRRSERCMRPLGRRSGGRERGEEARGKLVEGDGAPSVELLLVEGPRAHPGAAHGGDLQGRANHAVPPTRRRERVKVRVGRRVAGLAEVAKDGNHRREEAKRV